MAMIQNSFLQKVCLTIFWGLCAAGLIEFYKQMIWRANQDINGKEAVEAIYNSDKPHHSRTTRSDLGIH